MIMRRGPKIMPWCWQLFTGLINTQQSVTWLMIYNIWWEQGSMCVKALKSAIYFLLNPFRSHHILASLCIIKSWSYCQVEHKGHTSGKFWSKCPNIHFTEKIFFALWQRTCSKQNIFVFWPNFPEVSPYGATWHKVMTILWCFNVPHV